MPKTKTNKHPDKILFWIIASLLAIGFIALISASIPQSQKDYGNIYGYFLHQLLYGFLLGGILGYVMYRFPYQKLKKLALPAFLLSLFLMLLVFVPNLSLSTRGAQRWLDFRLFTFQPSEFIKLTFIIYLAAWLSNRAKEMNKNTNFIAFTTLLGVLLILLILQPDLSTFGVIVFTAGAMYLIGGAEIKHLALLGAGGGALAFLFIKLSPYRSSRILAFIRRAPEDSLGIRYHINQSMVSIGSGRWFGAGILQGPHKAYLPIAMSDSIFSVWAEETGLVGGLLLIILFSALIWRGLKLSTLVTDNFARLILVGISFWFFVQAAINIAAMMDSFPITGVTLPFISYGSSSMIVTLMAAGLMLQLSKGLSLKASS